MEILAVWGFGDIGPQARTRMVRDRFISKQQNYELKCHLDSVPPDTPIREIVDRCRVWESHTDQNRRPPLGTYVGREHPAVASDSRESSFYTEDPLVTDTPPGVELKVPVSVVHDVADGDASVRGEWDRVVSDWSVNYAGPRELLPGAGDCSGIVANQGSRRRLGMYWPSLFLGRSCPRWWHVSYDPPSRKTRRRRKCLWMPKPDGSNTYHLRVHQRISPYRDRGTSDGVFFVWSFVSQSQLVLSNGHCFSVLAFREGISRATLNASPSKLQCRRLIPPTGRLCCCINHLLVLLPTDSPIQSRACSVPRSGPALADPADLLSPALSQVQDVYSSRGPDRAAEH